MTDFLWNFSPFLVGGMAALTVIFLIFCARTELRLAARRKISLANYRQKSNLFYITKDKPFAISTLVMAVACAAVGVLCVLETTVRLYAIPMGLLVLINLAIAYLSVTRHKCARDVRVFDVYYVRVEDVLARKARTLSEIRICQQRIEELRSKLSQTIAGFNRNLAVGISGDFLGELFAPLDEMINGYLAEIDSFSVAVENNFNAALHEFLHAGTVPEFEAVPLRHFDEITVSDLLAEIKSSYGGRIAGMVVEQVNQGAVKNARSLGNIMSLMHKIEVEVDTETLSRFLHAASRFEDRAELAELLYRNKQIPLAMVRKTFIPEDWVWTFVPGLVAEFNARELTLILSDVLEHDRKAMCYRMLTRLGVGNVAVLEKALENEKARSGDVLNAAARLAEAYLAILSNTYAVGNSGNLYENLAYMIYDHIEDLGLPEEMAQKISMIVKNEDFYAEREEIAALYAKCAASGGKLIDSTTKILLQYILSDHEGFLQAERVAALFSQYRVTLSFGDMATMRALLAAWLLLNSKDAEVLQTVLNELERLPVAQPFAQKPPVEAAAQIGRAILVHLTQKDRVRLRSVIYRTESDRVTLDRVLTLCERGHDNHGGQ